MADASKPSSDTDLVQRALDHDRRASRELVQRLTSRMRATAANSLRRAGWTGGALDAQVEDLVQDAFLLLWRDDARRLRAWDPARGMSLQRYVCMVVAQAAASMLRSRRHNPHSEVALEDAGAATPTPEPVARLEARDTLQRLLPALGRRLSPRGRRAFNLLFLRTDLDEDAVATDLGVTRSAAIRWRSRLRATARELRDSRRPTRRAPQLDLNAPTPEAKGSGRELQRTPHLEPATDAPPRAWVWPRHLTGVRRTQSRLSRTPRRAPSGPPVSVAERARHPPRRTDRAGPASPALLPGRRRT